MRLAPAAALLVVLAAAGLSGCGNKGPLVLPPKPAAPVPATSATVAPTPVPEPAPANDTRPAALPH